MGYRRFKNATCISEAVKGLFIVGGGGVVAVRLSCGSGIDPLRGLFYLKHQQFRRVTMWKTCGKVKI